MDGSERRRLILIIRGKRNGARGGKGSVTQYRQALGGMRERCALRVVDQERKRGYLALGSKRGGIYERAF